MKQKFRLFKQLSINLIMIIVLYSSCQTDELMNESQNSFENEMVSKSKELLEISNPDLTILQYTKNILWENAIISNGAKGEIVEVPIVLLDHIGTMNNNSQSLKDFHRLLFMRDNKNNLKVYHLQIITNPKSFNNLTSDFNFYSINANFDGIVTLSDSNKQTVDYLRIEDGEKIKPSKASKEAAITCIYLGWWYEDGSFRPISLVSCYSGGGESETTGYGYQGGGGSTNSTTQSIEDNIDDSGLDSCSRAILNKLKNATNADIKSIFDKLGVKSETYILTFKIADNNGNPGSTTQTSYNCYQTVIDNDFLYGIDGTGINKPPTDLAIGAVMIHEIVHAYFFSLYDDKINSGVTNSFDNFDVLYQNYVTKTYVGSDDAQHAQIWKNFIGSMASALQEYHTGSGVNPSQFYQDIILGTLMGTQTFKDKYPQDGIDYKRILNNWLTEKNNQNNDPSYKPQGKPCQI